MHLRCLYAALNNLNTVNAPFCDTYVALYAAFVLPWQTYNKKIKRL